MWPNFHFIRSPGVVVEENMEENSLDGNIQLSEQNKVKILWS